MGARKRVRNLSQSDDRVDLVATSSLAAPADSKWRRYFKLFAIKPVTIFYAMAFLITGSVTSQLWIDRTCSVDLGYNATVCANLTQPEYKHINEIVQKQVTNYNIYGTYFEVIQIISALYLGLSYIFTYFSSGTYTNVIVMLLTSQVLGLIKAANQY
jgi:hypothetical protein